MTAPLSKRTFALILLQMTASLASGQEAGLTPASASGEDIEEITIYGMFAEPERVAGSAHRVDQDTLEAFDYDDIGRVLNLVPGVYLREEDGLGLRPNIGLRGSSTDRSQKVLLMEDGVMLSPAPYSAPAAYFFPLTTRMVGVEVFKGPASIQFGPQTIGGAMNLISAPIPEGPELMTQIAGGNFGYRHLHARAGTLTDQLGVLFEYVHVATDGFKDLDGGGDTGFDKNEFVLKSAHEFGDGKLELRLTYADEVSDETYLGLTEADFRDSPQRRYAASVLDRMEWEWLAARASWQQPLLGGTLDVTGYVQQFDRAWLKFNNFGGGDIRDILANPESPFNQLFVSILNGRNTDGVGGTPDDIRIGTNDRSFDTSGIQGGLRWEFGGDVSHALEVGARLHTDRIRRLHDEFGYEQLNGDVVLNDQPRAITADNTGFTRALALWVRDDISFGRWRIVPGLRLEVINNSFTNRLGPTGAKQDNDYVIGIPGIGTSFDVNENLMLIFGVHKGFSPAAPSLTRNLDPEESINYELGGRFQGGLGRFEAIGFYNDYSNLTAICTFSSGCPPDQLDTQINAGEVRTYGIEAGWNHEFEVSSGISMPIALTYTFTDAEFREAFTSSNPTFGDVEPGFEPPYVPPHRANLNVGFVGNHWRAQLSVTHTDRMRDQAGRGAFAIDEGSDDITVVDLAAHYSLSDRWSISGRVDNVGDDVYVVSRRPFGARPGKPRSYQLMVTYRL